MSERPVFHRSRQVGLRKPEARKGWFLGLVLASWMVLGASAQVRAADSSFVQHDPPSAKDALRLVFHNAALPLPDDASCRDVDTSGLPNPTLGDWLAGILAVLEPAPGTSGVIARCDGPLGALSCQVHLSRQSGEEVWRWGVRFTADGRSGLVDPASIVCDASG